jgi:hypothetical protein
MLNYNYGIVPCKNNKERKLIYKQLKSELSDKPNCSIWYEKNDVLYSYQYTRKQMFTV